tara:strand:+ start:881 stop:1279 length:399 start_codon:yes stop_codon:yes gene_type:complete
MFKIYKIIDNTNGNIYIGQTQKSLYTRLHNHTSSYLQYLNNKREGICSSFKIIKNGDYKIELIEKTNDKNRERYWIENTECINKNIPLQTKTEKKEYQIKVGRIRNKYYKSWGGSPYNANNSLLKISIDLFH